MRIGRRERIRVLHVNHGWRGEASDRDAAFVQNLGGELGIPVDVRRVEPPQKSSSDSWEADAREKRKAVFSEALSQFPGVLFTAHQSEDLAETLLWRLCTGTAKTHGGGILVRTSESFVRPLLTCRRAELEAFLEEEGVTPRIDSTNQDPRFLRARMRTQLWPLLEELFPRAVEHLVTLALDAQSALPASDQEGEAHFGGILQAMISSIGARPRRAHWDLLAEKNRTPNWSGILELPGGWRLSRGQRNNPGPQD